MRQLRAWRVAGPELKSAPHTNPTRSLCHPPRLLLLLSTRAAGGGRRVYRGGGEAAAVSTAAKVTICSGGMVRARLARGETGHREQRDRKSIAGAQHAGTPADNYDARVAAGWAAIGERGLHPTRPLPRPNFPPRALHLCNRARPPTRQYNKINGSLISPTLCIVLLVRECPGSIIRSPILIGQTS